MATPWTDNEIEFIRRHLVLSTKSIYDAFIDIFGSNRSYDSVQKKVKAFRDAFSDHDGAPDYIEDSAVEDIEEIVSPGFPRVLHVTAAEKRAARQDAREWLREVIEVTREEMGSLAGVVASGAVRSDKSSLVVIVSDVHDGKHNKFYNLATCRQRLRSMPVLLKERDLPEIDEVVIMFLGDMVEGEEIYATQANHIECPVFEQMQHCSHVLWEMVLLFRLLFRCRVRVETVPGNHGRMSKSASEKSNWDNVVYHLVRVMANMHDDPEIIVNACFNQFNTVTVKDKTILMNHKGVKHAGTPAMREKVAGWAMTKDVDMMVHGHWHEWHIGNWLGKLVNSNGSVCGPDDLSESLAKEHDPCQGYFLVTPGIPMWGFSYISWPGVEINTSDG